MTDYQKYMDKAEAEAWAKGREITIDNNERVLDWRWSVRTSLEKVMIIVVAIGTVLVSINFYKGEADLFLLLFIPGQLLIQYLLRPWHLKRAKKERDEFNEFKKYHNIN